MPVTPKNNMPLLSRGPSAAAPGPQIPFCIQHVEEFRYVHMPFLSMCLSGMVEEIKKKKRIGLTIHEKRLALAFDRIMRGLDAKRLG